MLVFTGLLVVAGTSVVAGGAPAATQPDSDVPDARLVVEDVSVTPETPLVGSPVTVSVSVSNSRGSTSAARIDRVELQYRNGESLVEASDVGSLSAGDDLDLPLTATFDEPGLKNVEVVVAGTDSDGDEVRIARPVSLVVEQTEPIVELDVAKPTAGVRTNATVTVSNPTQGSIRDVVATVASGGFERLTEKSAVAELAAGESTRLDVGVRPQRAGDQRFSVDVSYTTGAGVQRSKRVGRDVSVSPLVTDVGVQVTQLVGPPPGQQAQDTLASLVGGSGSESEDEQGPRPPRAQVRVTNFGNAPVKDVVVVPNASDAMLAREPVATTLSVGESRAVTVDLSTLSGPADLNVAVDYRVGTESGTQRTTLPYRPDRGRIRLTGINVTQTDERTVTVSGNAGNIGTGAISGLVVEAGDGSGVAPADQKGRYFVGPIESGQFTPFEVQLTVTDENQTTVPLNLTYRVDDQQRTRTVRLGFNERLLNASEESTGGGSGFLLVGLLVVTFALVGIYVIR
ncbi:hypothetical protein [Halorientalis sp.]|uniref:hypothetical protein n=1 Tax=Halorientalis sp. TaxID=1931229 RepID=UPI00260AFA98|nr:hypothetical protein [Halorientalis sp.]